MKPISFAFQLANISRQGIGRTEGDASAELDFSKGS